MTCIPRRGIYAVTEAVRRRFPLPRSTAAGGLPGAAMRDLAVVKGAAIGLLAVLALWALVGCVVMLVWRLLDVVGL